MHEHLPIVAALFERGADANAKDELNRTPLLIYPKNAEIVSLLLKNNADLSVSERDRMTPLHWACNYGSLEIVKLLVEHNCQINTIYSEFKINALMLSSMKGNL
jgi:ankyrin repeat protein